MKISLPEQGKYLFYIQLNQKYNYEDTFLLELTSDLNDTFLYALIQSQWMIIIPVILGIFLILMIIICTMMIVRKRRYNKIHHDKQVCHSSFKFFLYLLHFILFRSHHHHRHLYPTVKKVFIIVSSVSQFIEPEKEIISPVSFSII